MSDDFGAPHRRGGEKDGAAMSIAPIPRISIQAFCETSAVAETIDDASVDRRMAKAHVKVHMGGLEAAVAAFRNAPTPNLIVIEDNHGREEMLTGLDRLSELCDPGSRVVVIGKYNDIVLYRELMGRGVSEYLVSPVDALSFMRAVSELYADPQAEAVGRIIAVTGAKGGVGASCIAHNLAWTISRDYDLSTVIVDMDLGFGTAGLDFNQDPPQGVAEAVFSPDRLDTNLVDRLLSKCTDRLSLLAAPATLERPYDLEEGAFEGLVDILRATTPLVVLDIPHLWCAWSRRMLIESDDVLIVATPDLASLRNAKNILDLLRASRPNDASPKLIMNMVGMPKRPEISVSDFAKALEMEPMAAIPFDARLFGTAANNGQMVAEVEENNKVTEMIDSTAHALMGRSEQVPEKRGLSLPFVSRFMRS